MLQHVEQEQCVLRHVFSGVRVGLSIVFCIMFCRALFIHFLLANIFSVLQFTASDYPFGIFNFSRVQECRVGITLTVCSTGM
jgi:hypothetical protein